LHLGVELLVTYDQDDIDCPGTVVREVRWKARRTAPLKASIHALINACLWSLLTGPDAKEEGVSTMSPDARPEEDNDIKLSDLCERHTIPNALTFSVNFIFLIHIFAQITDEPVQQEGISLRICVAIPVHKRNERV
jgi:hypothetical protein